ncbi:ribonuclease III [Oscillospiraceae bacterium HV4-5-C5C]|nr:ribonuclease III [Oscillospiraceae bacterium HV4-5-C5C]
MQESSQTLNPDLSAACSQVEKQLAYHFNNRQLLMSALTHRSYVYEHQQEHSFDNERLEFLGDAVLGLVIGDALFQENDRLPEGQLSRLRAAIVCEPTLARAAAAINLGSCLRFGKGEGLHGGAAKPSNLSNAMEAIFAAVYLDGGYPAARRVVLQIMSPYYQEALTGDLVYDYKTSLLEYRQAHPEQPGFRFLPTEQIGPMHDCEFVVKLFQGEDCLATGRGRSKKQAEQAAARQVWLQLKQAPAEGSQAN